MARKGKRRRANKTAGKSSGRRKSGFPAWVKPTLSMIVGGGVGLISMALLPEGIAPYAPALGVLGSKLLGGGSWGKYATVAAVVGGVTFLSKRKTVLVAAGALNAAKRALTSGGGGASGSTEDIGNQILRDTGVKRGG